MTFADELNRAGMLHTNARVYRAEEHERTGRKVIERHRITVALGKKTLTYYATVVEKAQR